MPPYCAAGFTGLLGGATGRLDINCLTLKGISSPEIMAILRCWGLGGALATSYRCVLLRPTHIHSASRSSILQEASAGVTDSLLTHNGLSTTLLMAQVTSALALVTSTQHTSPLTTTFFKIQQLCNTGLPQHTGFHQHSHATHLHTVLSLKCGNEGRGLELRLFYSFQNEK